MNHPHGLWVPVEFRFLSDTQIETHFKRFFHFPVKKKKIENRCSAVNESKCFIFKCETPNNFKKISDQFYSMIHYLCSDTSVCKVIKQLIQVENKKILGQLGYK